MLRWSVPLKSGPRTPHRFFGRAAGPVEHRVYFFGGFFCEERTYCGEDQIDVHVFNTVTLCLTTLPPVTRKGGRGQCSLEVPSMRKGHTAALIDDTIYIWGGCVNCKTTVEDNKWFAITGDRYDDILYAFDVDSHRWSKPDVSGTVPKAWDRHSACVLEKVMVILGGWHDGCVSDIYKLDTNTMVWSVINTSGGSPGVSMCHSAIVIGTKVFVLKGFTDSPQVFDMESNCWMSTPSVQPGPEPRAFHSVFAHNGELYLIGGSSYMLRRRFNDMWKFNPKTFSWTKVEPKGKGPDWVGSTDCCCMLLGDRVILVGPQLVVQILHLSPSLKTLCKLEVVQSGLERL